MQEQNGLTPDGLTPGERELESAMRSLAPSAARIDPIVAAFAAGRRTGQRPMRLWRAVAVLMLFVSVGSWFAPMRHNTAIQPREISEPAVAIQPAPAEPLAAESMQVLEQTVREKGLDGLPAANIPAVREIHADDIF